MRFLYALIAVLALAGPAAAESVIVFEDEAGDPETSGAPPVGGAAVDILGAGLAFEGSDIVGTVTVADLDQVADTDTGVMADTMFIVRWHADGDGRSGAWSLRGDYQPGNAEPWSFHAEGPCLDGDDTDGCAGEDRDIIDDIDGAADLENDTVSIRLPVARLGDLTAQTWSDFHATVQQVWPAYPVYTSDWAYAPEGETRTFAANDADEETASAPSGNETTDESSPGETSTDPGSDPDEASDDAAPFRVADEAADEPAPTAAAEDTPFTLAWAGGVVFLAAVARRRP